jgi:hypothetical protein
VNKILRNDQPSIRNFSNAPHKREKGAGSSPELVAPHFVAQEVAWRRDYIARMTQRAGSGAPRRKNNFLFFSCITNDETDALRMTRQQPK